MTVLEAIHEADSLTPNVFSQEQKMEWLDRLDSFVRCSVLEKYPRLQMDLLQIGNPDRELLMKEPFDEAYVHWLESKIHYFNEEIDRYNGSVRMFRNLFEDYQRQLIRKEMPGSPGTIRF